MQALLRLPAAALYKISVAAAPAPAATAIAAAAAAAAVIEAAGEQKDQNDDDQPGIPAEAVIVAHFGILLSNYTNSILKSPAMCYSEQIRASADKNTKKVTACKI